MFGVLAFGGAMVARLLGRWEAWAGYVAAAFLGFVWGWAVYGFDMAVFGTVIGSLAGFAGPELARGVLGWAERHTLALVVIGTLWATFVFAPVLFDQLLKLGIVLGMIYLAYRTMFGGARGRR